MTVKEIKREAININKLLSTVTPSDLYNRSTGSLNSKLIDEFKSQSKPINLISLGKDSWTSTIIYYDNEFLYVRVPSRFELPVGAPLVVQFPTDGGGFVNQTFIHKIDAPILCLKLQNTRKDRRFRPLSSTSVNYAKVSNNAPWLNDKNTHIIRLVEEHKKEGPKIIVKDAIGIPKRDPASNKPIFSIQKEYLEELRKDFKKARLHNISSGGISVNIDRGGIFRHDLIHIGLSLENEKHSLKKVELSMFGIVSGIFPLSESSFRCGINFINRITVDPFYDFLQQMHSS